ncbi:hypothetical protein [Bradyrhizobium sp. 139]|uniref:hypothetical protein n=1 Tax=Bradyrhizobium sp. 139 TaxID=2782616 RepID=UPI0031FEC6B9
MPGLGAFAGRVHGVGRFSGGGHGFGQSLCMRFGGGGLLRLGGDHGFGANGCDGRGGFAGVVMVVMFVPAFMAMVIMIVRVMVIVIMGVVMIVLSMFMVIMFMVIMGFVLAVMLSVCVQILTLVQGALDVLRKDVVLDRLGRGIGASNAFDDVAPDAFAMTTAAGVAMARAATAVGAILALFLGLAMSLLLGLDQRLPVGDRDLVVVGMDFAEGEKAVAVAAIFDEGGLERRLHPGDLGEVDIPAQLLALRGLEIKLFDAIAADHDDPGLLRVGGIDQHLVGHVLTLGGGGRDSPWALSALPGDATVHLIRG